MSVIRLKNYLDNINEGKPINLLAFRTIISQLSLRHRFELSDISAIKQKKERYLVTEIHPLLLQELQRYTAQGTGDRISAARQNASHNHNVIGSYLLVIQNASKDTCQHPVLITFDGVGGLIYPNSSDQKTQAKNVLILENRQLFLRWQQTISFLELNCGFFCSDFDIVFGAGNEIANPLHTTFLSKYGKMYFCFDIDLGGASIAKSLINRLPNTPYEFLMPYDIDARLEQVVELKTANDISALRAICHGYDGLSAVCSVISRHFKSIEQESFLHE